MAKFDARESGKMSVPRGAKNPKDDAKGQFVRRRTGSNPTRNPDGVHSANPVVLSGNGDATQPYKKGQREQK